jgi:lipoate-protein ligase A
MALDDAMCSTAAESGAVFMRVYGWQSPTLSLGRHQRATGLYDLDAARERGISFVRRPTGGRAVLHWREITYCVAAPTGAMGSLGQSYRMINEMLVDALRQLGVAASIASPETRPPRPVPGACFEEPVAGEIVAGGRKLVGSAQWRGDGGGTGPGGLLQHGSILIDDDQALANSLLRHHVLLPPPAATLRALIGRAPTLEQFAHALGCAVSRLFGRVADSIEPDDRLLALADARRSHYASNGWTWRR